jgi:hypothetical protein
MDLGELMSKVGTAMQGGRSFGPAIEHDGVLIIPVAYVVGGGGGGEGPAGPKTGRPQSSPLTPSEVPPSAPPQGGGGGFGFVSWPIGAYVVKNGEVTFKPSFDVGLVLMLARSLLKAVRGRTRGRRALRK